MNDFHWKMLWDAHRDDLAREAEQARRASELPGQPASWRTVLVVVVVLIGMIALWIH